MTYAVMKGYLYDLIDGKAHDSKRTGETEKIVLFYYSRIFFCISIS